MMSTETPNNQVVNESIPLDNDQDTYASIVNVYGRTRDVITMLTNVVPVSFVKDKTLPFGFESTFHMSMTPKNATSSVIKISIKPDTCFFLLGPDNVYSPNTDLIIITDKKVGNGLIEGMILCYNGLASLDLIKQNITQFYRVIIEDTIGMIVPLNKIDELTEAYLRHQTVIKSKLTKPNSY